jgi:putative SOS response-associated peptidase YedK
MCSNYRPVTRLDRLLTFFGVERDRDEPSLDVFPLGLAPFIRLRRSGACAEADERVVEDGIFGLLPPFASEVAFGRKTYNARSETVAVLASFRDAWRTGQRCIVPAECIFEASWETGKAVRWRIGQHGDVPMGIAGIYTRWSHPDDGRELYSFAMLTVNADGHPVMQRFHRADEEKRMVVILDPSLHDRWLGCKVDEASAFFKPWMGPLVTEAAPLVRAPRTVSGKVVVPPVPSASSKPDPQTGELF